MTTLTEGRHAAEFIVSEANGSRSRSQATVLSGEDLVSGEVVEVDGNGKLLALSGLADTAGDIITEAAGVTFDAVDATAGDVTGAVFYERDCEVNGNDMTFPAETSVGERALAETSLALLGIIVRN